MIGCNKTGVQTVCTNILYFLDALRINILLKEQQQLLLWRTSISEAKESSQTIIFMYHEDKYIIKYSLRATKCSNIFNSHKKTIIAGLRKISLEVAISLKNKGIQAIPGKKLCSTCRQKVANIISEARSSDGIISPDNHVFEQ